MKHEYKRIISGVLASLTAITLSAFPKSTNNDLINNQTVLAKESATVIIDGKANTENAVALQKYIVNSLELNNGSSADYNGDNKINVFDVIKLKRKIHTDFIEENLWDGTVDTDWYNDEKSEFHIKNAKELAGLNQLVDQGNNMTGKTFYLDSNICINDFMKYYDWENTPPKNNFNPIGRGSITYCFNGTFDGQGHSVYGLYSEGLFAYAGKESSISNLKLINAYTAYGGSPLCETNEGKISNCEVYGKVRSSSRAGGICRMNSGTITNCVFNGDISSYSYAGGICRANTGTITDCTVKGTIKASADTVTYAGGISGSNSGKISNCNVYASSVEGYSYYNESHSYAGGICGANSGEITGCRSYAQILSAAVGTDSTDYAGGICGIGSGIVNKCYNYANVSSNSEYGESYSGGICGNNSKDLENCANYGDISADSKSVSAYSGGVCGSSTADLISNCFNTGEINSSSKENSCSGGICGKGSGVIKKCYNYDNVSSNSESGESYSGGICGNNSKNLDNCANYGDILADSKSVSAYSGGVCGSSSADLISNCFNTGEINSSGKENSCSGGISGKVNAVSSISNVYNTGLINSGKLIGGISGYGSTNVGMKNCYYLDSTSEKGIGNIKSDDAVISNDKEMKTSEFANKLGEAYSYLKNSYPVLADMTDIPTDKNATVHPKEMPVVTTAQPFVPVTTTTTVNAKSEFTWGEDNFSFCNTRQYFRTTESEKFDLLDKYRNALRQNMNNAEWQKIVDAFDNDTDGDCYGMTVLAILAHEGIVPYDMFTKGAKCLNDMEAPVDNDEIKSLVHYYQLLSFKDSVLENAEKTKKKTNEENIKNILEQLKNSHMVAVCFRRGALSHVVAAYDVTYGEYTFDDNEYQGKIEILDPTFSLKQDDRWCLYFNTTTYDWMIPGYKCDSTGGAIFTNILYGLDMLNDGGYLGYTNDAKN